MDGCAGTGDYVGNVHNVAEFGLLTAVALLQCHISDAVALDPVGRGALILLLMLLGHVLGFVDNSLLALIILLHVLPHNVSAMTRAFRQHRARRKHCCLRGGTKSCYYLQVVDVGCIDRHLGRCHPDAHDEEEGEREGKQCAKKGATRGPGKARA
jgi:hypothetical protein